MGTLVSYADRLLHARFCWQGRELWAFQDNLAGNLAGKKVTSIKQCLGFSLTAAV